MGGCGLGSFSLQISSETLVTFALIPVAHMPIVLRPYSFRQDAIACLGEFAGTVSAWMVMTSGRRRTLNQRAADHGAYRAIALHVHPNQTMFIFLGLGCVKTAQDATTSSQTQTAVTLSNDTILFISTGMGLSLLITAWVFCESELERRRGLPSPPSPFHTPTPRQSLRQPRYILWSHELLPRPHHRRPVQSCRDSRSLPHRGS